MLEPRITISYNPRACLKRFKFPLNGQLFNGIGINPDEANYAENSLCQSWFIVAVLLIGACVLVCRP